MWPVGISMKTNIPDINAAANGEACLTCETPLLGGDTKLVDFDGWAYCCKKKCAIQWAKENLRIVKNEPKDAWVMGPEHEV